MNDTSHPINARRFQRYELETEVSATHLVGDHGEIVRGRALNINEGGIGAVFASGWDVGTLVNLQFSVPVESIPFRVRGVVRNRTDYRYGFEFVDLTTEQQETISRTCRTLRLLQ
jgi:c-di-GMP-binding flagellar brake protein YcgR